MQNQERRHWTARWTVVTGLAAWMLANGLDVFSVLLVMQMRSRPLIIAHHVGEYFVIYAGMRLLGTLALALLVLWLNSRRPSWSRAIWGGLTICSLATSLFAWLRVYR